MTRRFTPTLDGLEERLALDGAVGDTLGGQPIQYGPTVVEQVPHDIPVDTGTDSGPTTGPSANQLGIIVPPSDPPNVAYRAYAAWPDITTPASQPAPPSWPLVPVGV